MQMKATLSQPPPSSTIITTTTTICYYFYHHHHHLCHYYHQNHHNLVTTIITTTTTSTPTQVANTQPHLGATDRRWFGVSCENAGKWAEGNQKACHNQIQLEALKVESGDSLQLIQEELVRPEKDITTNQYNRHQNLIIEGIPDHVRHHHLENVCLDIHIIEPVGNYEVVGCHRNRKGPHDVTSSTIFRFDFGNWSLNFRDYLKTI